MARAHGGRAAFRKDRCPCDTCHQARERQRKLEKHRRVYGKTGIYVDAEPARKHVQALLDAGMTRPRVAAAASALGTPVNRTQIRNLLVGQPPLQGPAKHLRRETAEALLAVEASYGPVSTSGWVDSTGTERRLQALNVIGYHNFDLARRLNMSSANFASFRKRPVILAASALATKRVYEELKDTPGPGMYACHLKYVTTCRRKGYLPPIWWDEDNIDDPTYDPHALEPVLDELAIDMVMAGEDVPLTRPDRIETVLRLHGQGLTPWEISKRMHGHVSDSRIKQIIAEHWKVAA